jgi:hypothetical protein
MTPFVSIRIGELQLPTSDARNALLSRGFPRKRGQWPFPHPTVGQLPEKVEDAFSIGQNGIHSEMTFVALMWLSCIYDSGRHSDRKAGKLDEASSSYLVRICGKLLAGSG